jgi:hypothetical protein
MKECIQCKKDFEFKTHNQKYCSPECCRKATNKKIMKKYYEKKEILAGKKRNCKCGSKLSRYNMESLCNLCQIISKKQEIENIKKELENASERIKKTNRRPRSWD